ncbi:CDP-glycerol glycerophosphotransferase family protein [Aeromicrobium sp. HA]|uniref:CDP-glycerol glycerophosphotransferase family protein n=1 Tax=Aeromicrobium sp. HA TaxID=3009077 RepID=UPI0022AF4B65|nr:CDP-glycerol glycerophosphotransferase family protein [Aeromicrobium sp. HA]
MPDVGRVRRRVVAMVPERAKDRLRRALGRGPAPRPHARLAIRHDAGLIHYSGEFRDPVRVVALVVRPASRLDQVAVRLEQPASARFAFTLDPVQLWELGGRAAGRFDLFVEVEGSGTKRSELRLGRFDHTDTAAALDRIELEGAASPFGEQVHAWTHVTDQGNVSVRYAAEPIRRFEVEGTRLDVGPRGIATELLLKTFSRPASDIRLSLQWRFSGSTQEIPVQIVERDATATHGLYEYAISFDLMPDAVSDDEREGIIDPHLIMDLSGFDLPVRVPFAEKSFRHFRLRDLPVPTTGGGHVDQWVPYLTFRAKRLAFWSERFTVDNHRYLRRISRWAWLMTPLRPFSGIWLVGEVPYKAQDNGFALFRWIRRNHPERRAYYVIDADSPDRDKVEPFGQVVTARSREHIRYTALASRFVGSHHAEYLHASRSPRLARHARGLRVFLQHGVTGMKNVRLNYGRLHMQEMPPDRVVVNSAAERQIFIEDLDFFPSQVAVTGFARYDSLFEGEPQVQRRLLVMPTWRDWLTSRESVLTSTYLANWLEFLNDPRIQGLQQQGVEILMVMHPNLRALVDDLPLEGISIAPRDADVQELIRTSAALVTDYSSVAWDAAFLRRPVFFFRFDDAVLTGARTPFVDAATELPGPIAHRAADLAAEVATSAESGFAMDDLYARRAAKYLELPTSGYGERNYEMVRTADGLSTRLLRLRNQRWVRDAFKRFRAGPHYYRAMSLMFRFGSLLPRRDIAVFESDRGNAYGGSPRALFERLHERGTSLDLWYVNNSTLRVPPGTHKVFRPTPRYFWTLSRAKYWVFNQNVHDLCQRPRGTHYLQTWHGTPLKRMQNDVPVMYGRADDYHAKAQELVDRWSSLVSPSPYATEAFRSAFGFTGPIIESGYPGNDVFHTVKGAQRARETRLRLGLAEDRTVVLYAPTFRDDGRAAGAKGAWAHDMALDLGRFAERLGKNVTLLVRLHPLVKFAWPKDLDASIVNVSKYPDTQDLLLVADALITDYSSIMFDYAQRGRPIISYVYDLEHYRDDLRGFYVDLEEIAPGPVLRTSDEVIDAVASLPELETRYADRLAAFRERFGGLEDGHAADRVIDEVFSESERGAIPD